MHDRCVASHGGLSTCLEIPITVEEKTAKTAKKATYTHRLGEGQRPGNSKYARIRTPCLSKIPREGLPRNRSIESHQTVIRYIILATATADL
jgi:hypothetical protein